MNNRWQDIFIETLYKKHPQRSQLVDHLADLLLIERESVYRKLRNEVKFSVEELMTIASAWNISLDEIISAISNEHLFKTTLVDYSNPSDNELEYLKLTIEIIRRIKNQPNSEYIEISNSLPRTIINNFPILAKYKLMAWIYQYNNKNETPLLSITQGHDAIVNLISEQCKEIKNIKTTTYIWDSRIFENSVKNIKYFYSIRLINNKEKDQLKKNLIDLLDYVYEIASKGTWDENTNKVRLYISHTNVDTNYSYLYSDEYKVCRIHAFAYSRIYTKAPVILDNFIDWIQSKKKASFLISKTDEKSRIDFFDKQRAIVQTL